MYEQQSRIQETESIGRENRRDGLLHTVPQTAFRVYTGADFKILLKTFVVWMLTGSKFVHWVSILFFDSTCLLMNT